MTRYALTTLRKRDRDEVFEVPVVEDYPENALAYLRVIKRPMDFQTMQEKIQTDSYRDFQSFVDDFQLLANNGIKFNPPGQPIANYNIAPPFPKWRNI